MSGAAGGAIANKLLRWLYPLPAGYAESGPTLDELRPKYRKWYGLQLLIIFAGWPLFGAVWWWLLQELSLGNARRFEPAVFHLYDAKVAIVIPAIFLGLVASTVAAEYVIRALLKERHAEYVRFANLVQQSDTQKPAKPVILVVLAISLIVLLAFLNWRAVFTQDEIFFQSRFGLSNVRQQYSDIIDLRSAPQVRAPNGKLVDRREYIVEFNDGTIWSTNQHPGKLDDLRMQKLFQFISARANMPIRELKILE